MFAYRDRRIQFELPLTTDGALIKDVGELQLRVSAVPPAWPYTVTPIFASVEYKGRRDIVWCRHKVGRQERIRS